MCKRKVCLSLGVEYDELTGARPQTGTTVAAVVNVDGSVS